MKKAILPFLLAAIMSSYATDSPLPQSREEVELVVAQHWSNSEFGQLEILAARLNATNALSNSGWPLLDLFYQALGGQMEGGQLSDVEMRGLTVKTSAWLAKFPDSQVARLAKADELIAQAWQVRGNGYADTVSDSQQREFVRVAKVASAYLLKNKPLLEANPRWYSDMLHIANVSEPEMVYRGILNEAWRRFPTDPFFFVDPLDHYSSRWGGSPQTMARFINESTAGLGSQVGDEMYARQYSFAIETGLLAAYQSQSLYDCARWQRGYGSLTARFPTSRMYNHAALASTLCDDKPRAKQYFAKLMRSPDIGIWDQAYGPNEFEKMRDWANSKP